MKKSFFKIIPLLALISVMASCTRVINLNLGDTSGQLVIEGNITNITDTQFVKLSTNVSFGNSNNYPPVTGATVTINDHSGNTLRLIESQPGEYYINNVVGVSGNIYTLTVSTNQSIYTANSTLPAAVLLDSVSDKTRPLNKPKNGVDQKVIVVYYQDPRGISNQYRFILWINRVQVKDVFVYDDELTDGRYETVDLLQQDIDVYPGDTATVEMQCIDKPIYTYWFTLEQQEPSPLGSVAPANPASNISPASLGYFSAHTSQTKTIIVK